MNRHILYSWALHGGQYLHSKQTVKLKTKCRVMNACGSYHRNLLHLSITRSNCVYMKDIGLVLLCQILNYNNQLTQRTVLSRYCASFSTTTLGIYATCMLLTQVEEVPNSIQALTNFIFFHFSLFPRSYQTRIPPKAMSRLGRNMCQ